MVDRFTYVPSIGIGLLTVAAFIEALKFLSNKRTRSVLTLVLSGAMLSILLTAHIQYLPKWGSDITLWTDLIEKHPRVHLAYNNRSVLLRLEGKYDLAIQDLYRAIELFPGYASAYWNCGVSRGYLGQVEKAEIDFLNAVVMDPGNPGYAKLRDQILARQLK